MLDTLEKPIQKNSPLSAEAAEIQLQEDIADLLDNPYAFVMYTFDWGVGELKDESGPDEWQTEILKYIGSKCLTVQDALRIAVRSGHGIGKTALIAWIILWFISTRPNPQIVVTANTGIQLETKTWREVAKWHKLAINQHWFTWTATKLYNNTHPETWFAAPITWSKERAQSFAGTHEKYVLMIFDEGSEIDDVIWDTAEGSMTTPSAMWVAFGNPTKNTGRFSECFKKYRHRWHCKEIDSRTAKKANQTLIQQWIEDYGEDSDFVRVRVKGMEPRVSSHQMFSYELVEKAMGRQIHISQYQHAPVVIGGDIARFGDAQTVPTVRQGLAVTSQKAYRGLDTMQNAGHFCHLIETEKADASFVDEGAMGAGVIDRCKQLGYEVIAVNFGSKATDEKKYFNKGAEMWAAMLDWLKAGGCIPNDPELRDDLTGRQYGYDAKGRLQLETKNDMKARGLSSPDKADSLCLTFAAPVNKRSRDRGNLQQVSAADSVSNDPFDYI